MDQVLTSVAVGALGELIATAIAESAGRTWKSLKGNPEARAVRAAIDAALSNALRDSALPAGTTVDDEWVTEVAKVWQSAFTPSVSAELVACTGDPTRDTALVAELASRALQDHGCDLAAFGRIFWLEEFLSVLPRRLFECLSADSLRDDRARRLVDHLLRQRADARARGDEPATPSEFWRDLITLLERLDKHAQTGQLPPYLPPHANVTALSRVVRVRPGVRHGPATSLSARVQGEDIAGRAYQLPVDRSDVIQPPRPWPDVAAEYQRLMVMADPGLGKSWLIRTETHRVAKDSLGRLKHDPVGVVVPVPARCDQLVAAFGHDLADKAASHLVSLRFLPERSRSRMAAKVRAGEVVLLLDALDELTQAETGPFRELLRSWADLTGPFTRCVITSRIAGYTGSPLPGALEVELQAFTPTDVAATVAAWNLPSAAARGLMDRARDPAIGAMARVPLLLALLCSLAAQLPVGEALPRTRGQLYDRILRWFLTRAHRSADNPRAPTLDDVGVEALLEILAPLAFFFASQAEGWVDLMPTDRLLAAIRATGPPITELRRPAADILRELFIGTGVLVPEGDPSAGRSPNYLFLHRTVAEYLVARHLASLAKAEWLLIVDKHRWFDPDWAEVIPMLGERLASADAAGLIQHLMAEGEEYDPFHHSLFVAIRIWGARPDSDRLVPAALAAELAELAVRLIHHRHTRQAVTSHLSAMAYPPQALIIRLIGNLNDVDTWVRHAAVQALASAHEPGVTSALLRRLHDNEAPVRRVAADALASREGPEVTSALLDLLRDSETDVREEAVRALVGREDPAVTRALLRRFRDNIWTVGHEAKRALASQKSARVTSTLLDCLSDRSDSNWFTRRAAAHALAGREEPEVTRALLDCLKDRDQFLRKAAALALADREEPAVTPALLKCLSDDSPYVRSEAARALAGRDSADVTSALEDRLRNDDKAEVRRAAAGAIASVEDPAVIHALRDPMWPVRTVAEIRALARWDGATVTQDLLSELESEDGDIRVAAIQALIDRREPGLTQTLLDRLSYWDVDARRSAAVVLASREEVGLTEALLTHLGSEYPAVRRGAARALAGRKDPDVTSALLDRLSDADASVRAAAAQALADRQNPEVTRALLDRLSDDNEDVRLRAEWALANREDPGLTQALLTYLNSKHPAARSVAARALGSRQDLDPEVTSALLDHLSDDNKDIRRQVIWALGDQQSPDPEVTLGLLECLDDRDVKAAAARVLAKRQSPGDLLIFAKAIRHISQPALLETIDSAERLMTRHYLQIETAEQPAIRSAMGRLTARALADRPK